MCGIAGWIDRQKNIFGNMDILNKMKESLQHRGPDDEGEWLEPEAGLVHRRLIVIDPEGGKQPMVREAGGEKFILVYNGELYNTNEIRKKLKRKGYIFQGHSDTEVILYSYIEWGKEAPEHLNGIFAFAVWEQKKKRLFIARDRLGVKPLFFAQLKDGLLFASEPKAILLHPAITPEIDREGLAEVLINGPGRTPGHGVFRGIKELKPGYYLLYEDNNLSIKQYWRLKSRPHEDSVEETINKVKELFIDTVQRQLVSDMPICTLLSGGLDSSAISAVASLYLKKKGYNQLHTYSVDYEGNEEFFQTNNYQPDNDTKWVDYVSNYIKTRHHKVTLDNELLAKSLREGVRARDYPGMADIDISLYLFSKEIKKDFVVAVSGECADELFGGYPWYFQEEVVNDNTFPWMRKIEDRVKILSKEVKELVKPEEYLGKRYEEALAEVPELPGERPQEARMRELLYLNLTRWMPTLLDRKDRMSMYTGLEIRVPFCDHRLVEYVWNVPWRIKTYGERRKGLLRAALEGILPDDVRYRPKNPYPKTFNPVYLKLTRQWLREIMANPQAPLLQLVDKKEVENLIKTEEEIDLPWFGQLMRLPQLFAYLIQLNIWLEEYHVKIV